MARRFMASAAMSILFGALCACGGGGGSGSPGGSPATSIPTTAPTATPTATPTPTPAPVAPTATPAPLSVSWYGINGYTATSPPNFVPAPAATGLGFTSPNIIYTAIGQTVHVVVTQQATVFSVPTTASVACNQTVGTLVISNATSGNPTGSFDVTLAKTTGADPLCSVGAKGQLGNYPGSGALMFVVGP
jgi:hypothetical protein